MFGANNNDGNLNARLAEAANQNIGFGNAAAAVGEAQRSIAGLSQETPLCGRIECRRVICDNGFYLEHASEQHEKAAEQSEEIFYNKATATSGAASGIEHHRCQLCERGQENLDIVGLHPTHVACFCGNVAYLEKLVEQYGTDPLKVLTFENARSVGEFAARGGHVDVLKFLHKHGIDLDVVNEKGATPLIVAAQEGDEECIRFLLEEVKANPHVSTKKKRNLLFFFAAFSESFELLKLVVEKFDVKINEEDESHSLCYCVFDDLRSKFQPNNFEIVKYLIEKVNMFIPDCCDEPERTSPPPIVSCCMIPDKEMAVEIFDIVYKKLQQQVLENENNENENNKNRTTRKDFLDSAATFAGITCWHAVASTGNVKLLTKLKQLNCNMLNQTKIGSPLHHACLNASAEAIEFLCEEMGCDPNLRVNHSEIYPMQLLLDSPMPEEEAKSLFSRNSLAKILLVKNPQEQWNGIFHDADTSSDDETEDDDNKNNNNNSAAAEFPILKQTHKYSHQIRILRGVLALIKAGAKIPEFVYGDKEEILLSLKNNNNNNTSPSSPNRKTSSSYSSKKNNNNKNKDSSSSLFSIPDPILLHQPPIATTIALYDFNLANFYSIYPPGLNFWNSVASYSHTPLLRYLYLYASNHSEKDAVAFPEFTLLGTDSTVTHSLAGSPADECAVSTVKYLKATRDTLGQYNLGGFEFSTSGLMKFVSQKFVDIIIHFVATSNSSLGNLLLRNKNRWENLKWDELNSI